MSILVIVAGQSNALVFGTKAEDLPVDTKVDDHGQIWNWRAQAFEVMVPGQNTNAGFPAYQGAFGPEVKFFRDEHAANPDEVVYFLKDKAVQGETPLAKDPNAWDWSPESRGEQWDKATAQIEAAKAHIPDLTKIVVLWMQGESDSQSPAAAAAYGKNLNDFIAHAKADWGADTVLIGRIADEWGADSPVRAAQDAHGAFSTDAFPMQADSHHFTGEGALMLGDAFWDAYHATLQTEPPAPPQPPVLDLDLADLFGPGWKIDLGHWFAF